MNLSKQVNTDYIFTLTRKFLFLFFFLCFRNDPTLYKKIAFVIVRSPLHLLCVLEFCSVILTEVLISQENSQWPRFPFYAFFSCGANVNKCKRNKSTKISQEKAFFIRWAMVVCNPFCTEKEKRLNLHVLHISIVTEKELITGCSSYLNNQW